jgi:hypothetical protein
VGTSFQRHSSFHFSPNAAEIRVDSNWRVKPAMRCMEEQEIVGLLELQRLTRELLDHLTAMFPVEEAAELLRAMADGLEARTRN